jgi:simple sugar transport system ATP-binding protein
MTRKVKSPPPFFIHVPPAVEMRSITKKFPGVVANDRIDFTVEKGEIHGLLGENGAGKTVLMNILYGLYGHDEGKIFIDGKEAEIDGPRTAIKLGIGMVHQHFMIVPSLTVAENIVLGNEPIMRKVLLDTNKALKSVTEFCDRYKLEVDLKAPIHALPVGMQQRVEILKALYRGADILILDEPTSVLTPQEVQELFKAIRALKEQGKTVIFISHKLQEVLTICDRITVLRRGRVVGTVEAGETNVGELATMMVGREVFSTFEKKLLETTKTVLRVENLEAVDDRNLPALKGVSFEVCAFEILGIAGVEGNGQTELVEALTGLRKVTSGSILLNNIDITRAPPHERIQQGTSHVPEDRQKRGLIMDFSVMENIILGSHDRPPFAKGFVRLDIKEASDYAKMLIDEFSIKTPSKDTPARHLSGGTQQRVVLAREFSRNPRLIIACQPTRGLDVGATEYVRGKLVDMRNEGCAVLLISADLDETWALSDRIAVMYEGRIVAVKDPEKTSESELGLLMAGAKPD